jgi:hypothetical protein
MASLLVELLHPMVASITVKTEHISISRMIDFNILFFFLDRCSICLQFSFAILQIDLFVPGNFEIIGTIRDSPEEVFPQRC